MPISRLEAIEIREKLRSMADKNGYITLPNRKRPVLRIFNNGSILRADVRLDLAAQMSAIEAKEFLDSIDPRIDWSDKP
jgi:hypothetical protein